VQSIADLQAEHGFSGRDVAEVVVDGSKKMAQLHGNQSPADNVAAQYSIAFCVAAALLARSQPAGNLHRPGTGRSGGARSLPPRPRERRCGFASSWETRTTVKLHDARVFSRTLDDVPGMPGLPFDADQLRDKFLSLTAALGGKAPGLLARLERIETEAQLDWLDARPIRNDHGIA